MPSFVFEGYWAFVNAPAKWAIDEFLRTGKTIDTWGVDKRHAQHFDAGQLAVVRVGTDERNRSQLKGNPRLQPGIYALCEVLGKPFPGSGANDRFWYPDDGREPGWPTVRIRYVRSYLPNPLLIATLRRDAPEISRQLRFGWQGASFPISRRDFSTVLSLLHESEDTFSVTAPAAPTTLADIAALELQYENAVPELREAVSVRIERGPIGDAVKKALGFKCQICTALGRPGHSFTKSDGTPYAEAHHVQFVSSGKAGSLSASNVIVVCPNHHRQLHYGGIEYRDGGDHFEFNFPEGPVQVTKFQIA